MHNPLTWSCSAQIGAPMTCDRSPSTSARPWLVWAIDLAVPWLARVFAGVWHGCRRIGPRPTLPSAALIVANHVSHADAAFLMAACGRRIQVLQAREQYDLFLLWRFFRLVGCIPVTRGSPDLGAIRLALERLQGGALVGIFPAGTVSSCGKGPETGHHGAALLALRSGAPIVPAYIDGPHARGILTDWVRPMGGVRVVFGPPIWFPKYHGQTITHERLRQATTLLMERIAQLRPRSGRAADTSSRG